MCGITGVYAFQEKGKSFFKNVKQSVETLKLRGPNSNGIIEADKACLGHTRLSIIDLSNNAAQPMQDKMKRYTIIYNGEIYNYKELQKSLIKRGLPLKTASDTEVILYLYIIEGPKCLEKLNGFFSFAIHDSRDDTLFIARDRMGIKPLLFYKDRDKIFFASEMKALMALGAPKKIDKTSISQYFQLNYIPSPHSIFSEVQKLPPGHYIHIDKNQAQIVNYYTIPYNRSFPSKISYSNAQSELQKLIQQSVQDRMIADVPLGAFLSGGVDSSVIVSEASKFTDQLNTFSIGYKDEPFFDETHYAELVAKKFNTNHQTFKLSNNDLYENLHKVLDYIDEPFADSSALPVHILSMHTKNHVTVSLSGDGADELFSGYNKHMAHFHAMHPGFKSSIIKMGLPLWKALPKSRNSKTSNLYRQLERYAIGLSLDEKERYWHWASVMEETSANDLFKFQPSLNALQIRKNEALKHILPVQSINDILYTDMQLVLVSDMLHKVDSMSMANGLEIRTPFLDHKIVDFVFTLSDNFKIKSNIKKRLLQDTYEKILPAEIYKRPKHGFEVPLLKWFQTELNHELFNNYLNKDFIQSQGMFNYQSIEVLKSRLNSKNPGEVHAQLWALLVFQSWWKKYMD